MNILIEQIRDKDYKEANAVIEPLCGIVDYFASEADKKTFVESADDISLAVHEDRASYGDWQTPQSLAVRVCRAYQSRHGNPNIILEPTCGRGSFILAALDVFPDLSEVYAVEINGEYTAALKYRILMRALSRPGIPHPRIHIFTDNVFTFDFTPIRRRVITHGLSILIIGNPPWVTNSRQGRADSSNVPSKLNIHNLSGIEAITGKSNFDISEYITLHLLKTFEMCSGGLSLLLKNSVVRNILLKQKRQLLAIGPAKQEIIDTFKEFNVSVEASCFSVGLNNRPAMQCDVSDFYTGLPINTYGWVGDSFVSDTDRYAESSQYDGVCPLEWRSGIKHDCAAILEIRYADGIYVNDIGEQVEVEEDTIYPLLKSSDVVKESGHDHPRYIILPQKRIGESTAQIKITHPRMYRYLENHAAYFARRKSSIYRGKDRFSIFGIGDYSFKPYKIVVSSLYKRIAFSLVTPRDGKPVMADDTCYQLGFDTYVEARQVLDALESIEIRHLIDSLVFLDAKRVVTKALLMRIDLNKYFESKGLPRVTPLPQVPRPTLFD